MGILSKGQNLEVVAKDNAGSCLGLWRGFFFKKSNNAEGSRGDSFNKFLKVEIPRLQATALQDEYELRVHRRVTPYP